MYGYALLCGWGLTAAVIALAWVGSKPRRGLLTGLFIGAVAGLLWPISLWIAVGSLIWQRRTRTTGAVADPTRLEAEQNQASAFARQAELEGMPTSAEYWRAEAQRLGAQRQAAGSVTARPAFTAAVVMSCTVAALATFGILGLTAPSPVTAPEAAERDDHASEPPQPVLTLALPAPEPAQQSGRRSASYTYRVEGNYRATMIGYTASNGDAVQLNDTGNIHTAGSELPWSLTVEAEPNGGVNTLHASTLSNKGDSVITCTIIDDSGNVVETQTGRGAYASCFASTSSFILTN